MASRDFHSGPRDLRDRLGGIVGSGDGYASFARRRALRRWALISAAILGLVAIAVVGYAIGNSQVDDAASARQEGATAGEQRGTAVGTREGYAHAYRHAKERAYEAAYRDAYRTAYLKAFERADLAAPSRVKVIGP